MIDALMVLGMVTVTWGVRVLPLLLDRLTLSASLLRFLNCVPPAVLAALIAEPVLQPVSNAQTVLQPELIAALFCLLLGLTRVPMLLVVVLGMCSYWLLRAWL